MNVLKTFDRLGLHFDCSGVYELRRALKAGIKGEKLEFVSQELTPK
jgi:diaminopimelate decarboxylase